MISRQVERAEGRQELKEADRCAKERMRKERQNALLERQTVREKEGLYVGRSVASAVSPSRSRIDKRKVQKGKPFGRILHVEVFGSREVSYHATKGWRSNRA